jgi:hypothetical protein
VSNVVINFDVDNVLGEKQEQQIAKDIYSHVLLVLMSVYDSVYSLPKRLDVSIWSFQNTH